MTEQELQSRIRASRNQPPPNAGELALDDWPDAPLPIEPRPRAERMGLGLMLACALPWLPIIWWITRHV
jgi:hypothetical protein